LFYGFFVVVIYAILFYSIGLGPIVV